ncbi:NAD-dependent epimerase/dehydratase family protein [Elusimicrobiota bacterium]
MKAVITGGTGYVGMAIAIELLREGYAVSVVSRNEKNASGIIRRGARWFKADMADVNSVNFLARAIERCDFFINLIGVINPQGQNTFERAHVDATKNALDLARKLNARKFVHMSALGTREKARSLYHRTKWQAEELVRSSAIKHTIFRPGIIFSNDSEFIRMIGGLASIPLPFILIAGASSKMQLVHLHDVVSSFARALNSSDTNGQIYELVAEKIYNMKEITKLVLQSQRKKKLVISFPVSLAKIPVFILEKIVSGLPVTADQLTMLKEGNISMGATAADAGSFTGFEEWISRQGRALKINDGGKDNLIIPQVPDKKHNIYRDKGKKPR